MAVIQVNGLDFSVETHGEGEPLLLIAGFTADKSVWDVQLPYLTPHFTVVTFDNRGAGQSSAPDNEYFVEDMVADTVALLEALDIDRAHVIGQSMGASIATLLAANHPELVDRLVLANGFPKMGARAQRVFNNLADMIQANIDGNLIMDACLSWCYANDSFATLDKNKELKERIDYLYNNPHPQSTIGYMRQLKALNTVDTREALSDIQAPCLVIAGEEDAIAPLKDAQYLQDNIKNAELVVMPNTAHIPHNEMPATFAKIVCEFLMR